MAHVAELPGCFAVGTDAPRAVGAVPPSIVAFLSWLKSHGERLVPEASVSRPSMADLYVETPVSGSAPAQAGSRAALFDYDKDAWNDEKVERTLRWLGYSRADLLARVGNGSEEALKSRLVAPGRSAWDTLHHIANAEYGYINRLAGPLEGVEAVTAKTPQDARERLAAVREIVERRARAIPAEKRGDIIYPTWASRPDEPWTLAKSLRRAIEHELEHLKEL